jgi:hypothetical protein
VSNISINAEVINGIERKKERKPGLCSLPLSPAHKPYLLFFVETMRVID